MNDTTEDSKRKGLNLRVLKADENGEFTSEMQITQEFYSLIKDSPELVQSLRKKNLFKDEEVQKNFNAEAYQRNLAFDEEEAEIRRKNILVK